MSPCCWVVGLSAISTPTRGAPGASTNVAHARARVGGPSGSGGHVAAGFVRGGGASGRGTMQPGVEGRSSVPDDARAGARAAVATARLDAEGSVVDGAVP